VYGMPETMGLDYKLTHKKTIRPKVSPPTK